MAQGILKASKNLGAVLESAAYLAAKINDVAGTTVGVYEVRYLDKRQQHNVAYFATSMARALVGRDWFDADSYLPDGAGLIEFKHFVDVRGEA